MARERFRDSDPVEEILRIAMQNEVGADASLRQRLLASASELGISEEAVLAAQQQWEEQHKKEELLEEYRGHVKRELLTHTGIYIVINVILLIINRLTSSYPWAIWPILGWGIGFGCHAVVSWIQIKNPGGDEFERWKRQRQRKGEDSSPLGPRLYGIHIQAGPRAISPPEPPSDNK